LTKGKRGEGESSPESVSTKKRDVKNQDKIDDLLEKYKDPVYVSNKLEEYDDLV
jgi:hypothetical protein